MTVEPNLPAGIKDPVGACGVLLKALRDSAAAFREQAAEEAALRFHTASAKARRDAVVIRTNAAADLLERWLNAAAPVFADLTAGHDATFNSGVDACVALLRNQQYAEAKYNAYDGYEAVQLAISELENLRKTPPPGMSVA